MDHAFKHPAHTVSDVRVENLFTLGLVFLEYLAVVLGDLVHRARLTVLPLVRKDRVGGGQCQRGHTVFGTANVSTQIGDAVKRFSCAVVHVQGFRHFVHVAQIQP